MKSIILKPHELQNIDRLACVVRPMKVQPPSKYTELYDFNWLISPSTESDWYVSFNVEVKKV